MENTNDVLEKINQLENICKARYLTDYEAGYYRGLKDVLMILNKSEVK